MAIRKTVQSDELRRKLRVLLNEIEAGDTEIVIRRYREDAALLVPVDYRPPDCVCGQGAGGGSGYAPPVPPVPELQEPPPLSPGISDR